MRTFFLFLCLNVLFLFSVSASAQNKVLNIYVWANEVPDFIVHRFEKETGIKVNLSTFENNEMMYAKLRASPQSGYDIIMPSSYFVDRMRKQNMLAKLNKLKLSNWKNLNPAFLNPPYDPKNEYSIPHIWGITGIFLNQNYFSEKQVTSWQDLWHQQFKDSLMLLDDSREVFAMALLSLGYSVNDQNPDHIKQAFLKLKTLMPNVKVFSTDTIIPIMIDEDATVGMSWNGDTYKASKENSNVHFIFPKEGFVIWVDNFCIPQNAQHKEAAYIFLNFILRPDVGRDIALYTNFPTPNLAAQKLLPASIRQNPMIYPSSQTLKRGQFQTDIGDDTASLYEKYWEELKIGG